jgi:histidyl-tRNA synthetase
VEGCQAIKEGAPILTDFLCPECQNHKRQVSQILAQYNIDATWNPRLVRGLDYYTGIVFEVKYPFKETVFDLLGGGRYDQVIEQLGGSATPSVGFACGIERMVATMREEKAIEEPASLCQVFVLSIGEEAKRESLKITDFLRKRGISVQHDLMGRNIRNQLKYADKQRALYTIIIGEDELDKGVYLVKEMDTGDQIEVESFWVENYILEKLAAL